MPAALDSRRVSLLAAAIFFFPISPFLFAQGARSPELPVELTPGKDSFPVNVTRLPFADKTGVLSNEEKINAVAWFENKLLCVRVVFPAEKELRSHLKWHWSPEKRVYKPGKEQEQTLVILWSKSRESFSQADAWVWRAARTDPAGWADDMGCRTDSIGGAALSPLDAVRQIIYDGGRLCWYSRIPSAFAGETLPRFYCRAPTESCADVLASGRWQDGLWTVLMGRKLKTGHEEDDLQFAPGERYYFFCLAGEGSADWRYFAMFCLDIPASLPRDGAQR